MTSRKTSEEIRMPTFAFAFLYAFVHACAKSGTSAGFSTGGGCLGELAGYTPGMGGPEEGEGRGTKAYGVTGMTDGPPWVSTLVVDTDDEGEVLEWEVDDDEFEGAAKARPAPRRTRRMGSRMDRKRARSEHQEGERNPRSRGVESELEVRRNRP